MAYDPTSAESRLDLAVAIIAKLQECGFEHEKNPSAKEAVYSRSVRGTDGKIRVVVYTTVVAGSKNPVVRACGTDSIRVCAVYTNSDGQEKGLVKETRIHRTGEIAAITDRLHQRMRSVYAKARSGQRCGCGAPKFTSKKGNQVCAELCWLKSYSASAA